MATIFTLDPISNMNTNVTSFIPSSPSRTRSFPSFSFKSTLFSLDKTIRRDRIGAVRCSALQSSSSCQSFDVVIVGAGIIGLTIARQFLIGSDLSVAVVDKAVPCSGATGAGQGYIWMANKTPGSDIWELAMRSHTLWKTMAENIQDEGMNPLEVLGWKKTGSLLVGKTAEDSTLLKKRVNQLSQASLDAKYLSSNDLLLKEPALTIENEGGASFLPDDSQLDAQRTVSYILKENAHFIAKNRYAEFFYHPVTSLLRSGTTGKLEGVQTSKNILYSKKAIIVAAGCWSGSLMRELVKDSGIVLDVPVRPRKGHLLVLENLKPFNLNHGLMEVGYADHQFPTQSSGVTGLGSKDHDQSFSVSMTATMDPNGNLLLGSSRQFSGFNTEVDESIIRQIWNRAEEFFPTLKKFHPTDVNNCKEVRIGLRPFMSDGKPLIGPVPGLSNVFLATGHEGGGLSMALGTAEMVADMVLGNDGKVDSSPFAVQGRCC